MSGRAGRVAIEAAIANPVLVETLRLAVPLWIDRLQGLGADQLSARASRCGTVIGSQGDALQYGGKGCVEAFNALAEGLAAAAFVPGGVSFAGLHFCVDHAECVAAAEEAGDV